MHKTSLLSFAKGHSGMLIFVSCWSAGLLAGTLTAACMDPDCFLRMRLASTVQVSIPGVLAVIVFPFLLSAYFFAVSKPGFIFLICFCKAFSFAFAGALIHIAFGSAGWLIRFLMQFTSFCVSPVFCWFCIRLFHGGKTEAFRMDLRFALFLCGLSALIDYFVISPFLVILMDF